MISPITPRCFSVLDLVSVIQKQGKSVLHAHKLILWKTNAWLRNENLFPVSNIMRRCFIKGFACSSGWLGTWYFGKLCMFSCYQVFAHHVWLLAIINRCLGTACRTSPSPSKVWLHIHPSTDINYIRFCCYLISKKSFVHIFISALLLGLIGFGKMTEVQIGITCWPIKQKHLKPKNKIHLFHFYVCSRGIIYYRRREHPSHHCKKIGHSRNMRNDQTLIMLKIRFSELRSDKTIILI